MRRLCLLQMARLSSRRVPSKLLLEFCGKRLIDQGLRRLQAVEELTGVKPILLAWPGDGILLAAAQAHKVEVLPIGADAVKGDTAEVCYAEMTQRLRDRFDWCFVANFLCRPFLAAETAALCLRHAAVCERPFVTTTLKRGLIWNERGQILLGHGETANTRENPLYHQLAHLGYGLPLWLLERPDAQLCAMAEPFPVYLKWEETVDIDTPEDAEFAARISRCINEEVLS